MKKLFVITVLAIIGFSANAQYTKLLDFSGVANGSQPEGSVIYDGTFLYGMTNGGGKDNYGVIFKIKPDGTGYDTLMSFLGASNGAFPRGSLITVGSYLYGMTSQGGTNGQGTIFKIKPDGSGYVKILDFDMASNGSIPEGDLMYDGTYLYGLAGQGGTHSSGTIFKIMPDGTGFETLYNFGAVSYDGNMANGSLITDGTFLYGTTNEGGTDNAGTFFKIKPDGTGYVKILDFTTATSGIYPEASLISVGNFLYGVAHYGGASSGAGGIVYKIKPDGSEYTVMCNFAGTNGCTPMGSLIYDGTFLYGMTSNGGSATCGGGNGTIFKIKPDGTGFSKLLDFTGIANGKYPQAALYSAGGYLYGMASSGGANNMGTLFKYYTFAIDNVNSTPVSCNGGNDGTATVIADGGATPYTYKWSTSLVQTTQTATGLTVGNYTVTVTDGNSSSATATIAITQIPAPMVYAGADTAIICSRSVQLNARPRWTKINNSIPITSLNSVYFTNKYTGYVVGNNGAIYKTTDAGTTWTQLTSGTPNNLNSVYFINADTGFAAGSNGTILRTNNGGIVWTIQPSGSTTTSLHSVYFTNANNGYSFGDNGTILKTSNGGTNWTTQTSGVSWNMNSVYFINPDTAFAVGDGGGILKTTDGGSNWTQKLSTSFWYTSVWFTSADTGYVTGHGGNGFLLKTTDGGNNWSIQLNENGLSLQSILFTSKDTGYTVGNNGLILATTNGGNNWLPMATVSTYFPLYSVYFTDAKTGYAVGSSSTILNLSIPVSYSWTPSDGLSNISIPNPIANPNVTTSYIVTGINENGCTAIDTIAITINPLTVNAGMYKNINCGGSAQLDSVTTNYTGAGTLTYSWSPASSLNSSTIINPLADPSLTTKYYVTVTTPNGCAAIDSVNVIVNPLTANAGFDKNIVCGGTVQLDNIVTNYTGAGTLTYSWSPASSLNSSTISNPIAGPSITTYYFVTVTTPNGCNAIDSVNVLVSPLTADAGTDKNIVCGGSVQLDNVGSNYTGTGSLSYHWSPSAGLNYDTIIGPTVTVTTNTKYFVTVTTPNGCAAIDSVSVTVNPLTANAGTNKTIFCGSNVQLDNVGSNYTGTGTLSYHWSPSTGLNYDTVPNPSVILAGNYTYTVTVTTPNGCSASGSVNVSTISMNATEICIVGVDSSNKNMIIWNKVGSPAIDSFFIYRETNITNVYQKIGAVNYDSLSVFADTGSYPNVQSNKYEISIKDSCGLESAKSAYHKTMHLTINQGTGNIWNLIWEAYEGFTVSTYNIYRGTTSNNLVQIGTSSGSNTTYSDGTAPAGDVYYQVEVISPNNCNPTKSYNSSRSNIAKNNPNRIHEVLNGNDYFTLYPNPATNSIIIETSRQANIEITNIQGQLIKELSTSGKKTAIDISSLSSGVYIVKVKMEKDVAISKFIKE